MCQNMWWVRWLVPSLIMWDQVTCWFSTCPLFLRITCWSYHRVHLWDFQLRTLRAQCRGLHPRQDHKIELKPGAPVMLISKTIKLLITEQEELKKFIDKHLEWETIRRSKSPYAMLFFFIKKKNGQLRPVQDYRPINEWTVKNRYPLPLIPQLIDRLGDAELITTVNIC